LWSCFAGLIDHHNPALGADCLNTAFDIVMPALA